MKILITILLSVAICQTSYSQNELPDKDGQIFFESVDSLESSSKDIYNKTKVWFAESFKDSKEVIQVDDRESGTIVGKGAYMFTHTITPYVCRFSVKVNIKDNKYRIQFYDFSMKAGTGSYNVDLDKWNKKSGQKKIKEKINDRILQLIEDLRLDQRKETDNDF